MQGLVVLIILCLVIYGIGKFFRKINREDIDIIIGEKDETKK